MRQNSCKRLSFLTVAKCLLSLINIYNYIWYWSAQWFHKTGVYKAIIFDLLLFVYTDCPICSEHYPTLLMNYLFTRNKDQFVELCLERCTSKLVFIFDKKYKYISIQAMALMSVYVCRIKLMCKLLILHFSNNH